MSKTKAATITKPVANKASKAGAKTKTSNEKEKFSIRRIGANIIATFGSEKYSRKVSSKEEAEKIMAKSKLYEKKPSETIKNAIIRMLTTETVKQAKEEEAQKAKEKGLKKQIKKETKTARKKKTKIEEKDVLDELETLLESSPEAIVKLEDILNKFRKVEEKTPIAQITRAPYPGEY